MRESEGLVENDTHAIDENCPGVRCALSVDIEAPRIDRARRRLLPNEAITATSIANAGSAENLDTTGAGRGGGNLSGCQGFELARPECDYMYLWAAFA